MYAIETSDNVKDDEMEHLKEFAVASLDYYNIGNKKSRFGLVSFGDDAKVSSTLSAGTDRTIAKYAIDYILPVGGDPNPLGMLNKVEEMFLTESPDKAKKLVVIFIKSSPTQLSDAFKDRLSELKNKGIRTALVFIGDTDDGGDDDVTDLIPLTNNSITQTADSDDLEELFPDLERILNQMQGG